MKKFLVLLLLLLNVAPALALNLPPGAEILTSPSQIKEYTILGQVGASGASGSYLYGVKKEGLIGGTLPVAGVTYTLAGSGITGSATSITLSSLTIPQTGKLLLTADFSSTFYVTLEPGNTKRQEIASCTTVTQNGNGSATLSGCTRGLLPFSPFTASSTYRFPHAGGTSLIFSDPPQLFNEYTAKGNDETITGQWTFSTSIPYIPTTTPTDDRHAVSLYQFQQATSTGGINGSETQKGVWEGATQTEMSAGTILGSSGAGLTLQSKYASSTGGVATTTIPITNSSGKLNANFGGSASTLATLDSSSLVVQNPANATSTATASKIPIANASGTLAIDWYSGVQQSYTAGESINASSAPLAVYVSSTDGRVYKTASGAVTTTFPFIGFAVLGENKTAGQSITVQFAGNVTGFTGMATGSIYYISTAGSVSSTTGTINYKIGRALGPTVLFIEKGSKVYSGTTSFSSTATSVITVGFMPSKVIVNAVTRDAIQVSSNGSWAANGGNNVAYMPQVGTNSGVNTNAWYLTSGGGLLHSGTVTTLTATGFTLSNTETSGTSQADLIWTASE